MTTNLTRGAIVAVAVALSAILGASLGLPAGWPVATASARIGALAMGIVVGILTLAMQAALLPAAAVSEAIAAVVAIAVIAGVAAVSGGRVPLWIGVVGYALFTALYLPVFEASPTTFLADAPVALVTSLLALAIGAVAATAADLLTVTGQPDHEAMAIRDDLGLVLHIPDESTAGAVAADTTAEGVN
jgi:hypothetical protein